MASIIKVKASDGTGNANVATVTTLRSPGASTILVNTVVGINPAGFMATMGTPHTFTDPITSEVITVISEATAVDFSGHVDSGHLVIDSIAPGYADTAGSKVSDIVVIRPTTQYADNLAAVLATSHADDGTLASTNGTLTTPTIISPTTKGTVDGWIGANESWAYASATTITVPTDATTKYAIGDMIKLTQSSTVKHFVITSLTSTVLTVTGLGGATVANSAITLNYYSKTRNPGTFLGGAPVFNPYKFSVYRNSSWNTGTGNQFNKVAFDTKTFDTGINFDVVTNNRFVAPIAGFYQFEATIGTSTTGIWLIAALYKNGVVAKTGQGNINATGVINSYNTVSGLVQLAANDYVEVYLQANSSTQTGLTGAASTYFDGFLVSAV